MSRLVTVIPVYNGERFLRATLESVVAQTRRPDRVIIQDNCSTDRTAAIAKEFEQEGFEWRLNEEHVSSTKNFNAALRFAAEADVLHLLTADDLVTPDFYERLLQPLESVEGRALAYAAYKVIDENGALVQGGDLVNPFPIEPDGPSRRIARERFIASQADLRTICLPAVLMKTNAFCRFCLYRIPMNIPQACICQSRPNQRFGIANLPNRSALICKKYHQA